MKQFLLLVFGLCILYGCKSVSSISSKKVPFDFSKPVYPDVVIIRPRQTLELQLSNLNPYLYEVVVKDSLVTFNSEPPKLFADVFKLPELNSVPAEAPPASDKIAGQLPTEHSQAEKLIKSENALQGKLSEFVSAYAGIEVNVNKVLALSAVANDVGKLVYDCSTNLNSVIGKANAHITSKLDRLDRDTLPVGIASEVNAESEAKQKELLDYIEKGKKLKVSYSDILNAGKPSLEEYRSVEKIVKEKVSIVDEILENSQKLLDQLKKFDEAKVGEALEENYKKVVGSRTSKSIFRTTYYRNDEVHLDVKVKKKNETYCENEFGNFPVIAIVRGGVKIDFSTGVILNMGRNGFFDQKYHYDSVYRSNNKLADSVKIARARNNNAVIPSIGAFLHVYSRLVSPVNLGGLVGASLGSDQRTYLHLGACILIGKSDRLILGGGVSIASAKILSGQYSEGQIMRRGLSPTVIPTEDATRIGGFVSVSWNLNLIK